MIAAMAIPAFAPVESPSEGAASVVTGSEVAGAADVAATVEASIDVARSADVELEAELLAVDAALELTIMNPGLDIVSAVSANVRPDGRKRKTQ
jgi:hypothetical protein